MRRLLLWSALAYVLLIPLVACSASHVDNSAPRKNNRGSDTDYVTKSIDTHTDKELQLQLAYISLFKTLATLFFGSALGVGLAHVIKQQRVDMEKAKNYQEVQQSEQENLRRYFTYTMDGDIYDRLKLAAFFKEILTDEESQNRWRTYYKFLEQQLNGWTDKRHDLEAMKEARTLETDPEYIKLQREIEHLEELIRPVDVVIADVGEKQDVYNVSGAEPSDQARFWPLKDQIPDTQFCEGMGRFAAPRAGGRLKAGVNLTAPTGTAVVVPEDCTVIRGPYHYYAGTYALEVKTDRGPVVRFGELKKIVADEITEGARVKAGEVVGYVGRVDSGGRSMLVFEMYSGTGTGNLTMRGNAFARRADLLDPTPYLLDLAQRAAT